MRTQLGAAVRAVIALTVLVGLAYPLLVTGVAQLVFHDQANGSLIHRDGTVVGSSLIGQNFDGSQWFHPRPSAAGGGYDAEASGPSNLGPSNPKLIDAVAQRVDAYRAENGLAADQGIPVDAVTASASGLDPDISVANARLQAPRVARARGRSVDSVLRLVSAHTSKRRLGFLGEDAVNVLELNVALDRGQ